ncbi:coiled-coil domain-containing protein 51-like isoform X2 [Trichoplusia ni]|uniref:Coiled-coil domain-containing protein 51-like isoform X2 n=1 Tax=Trichoplusia ni TaxID=7111 RepID=A0A7E5WGZ4_TRINI|nr:coiled-coil domain-containing protein 51-like isoform X2 [Trichoplusia ni]
MADKLRQVAQRIKDRVHLQNLSANGRERVDQIVTKYVPAVKVTEIAEKLKYETVTKKVRELVSKYEKFTGVEEIMALQNTVVDAQERFIAAQERRRELGRQLASIESRLKELHAEMQNTMKGDEKYLHLCTEEHKLIIQERALRALFGDAEREERELFATMSAAVKLGHERERAHAERNKYWYIVASIFGTVLGIAGSSINNHLKMAEFRDMMEQQMARSASVLYTIAGGGSASRADITDAMKTEFAYQEQLAQNLKLMQENITHLVDKQESLIEHLHHRERSMDTQLRDLTRAISSASQTSARSDAEIAKALSVVHQDLEDVDQYKETDKNKVLLEPNQILTGVGVIMCIAIIFGNVIGRIS